ncbi:MAG: dinitrogenase iron-molybdenum cofactor biosynthesis protein, partial [Clostridiales bacterium]
ADNQVDSLLTVRCGQNAAVVFETAQIKIYKTISATAGVNITAFEEGKLALMTQFHPGFQGLQ